MASNPNRIKHIEDVNQDKVQVITVNHLPEYHTVDYELEDDKDREKYFKDIEAIVRGSYEYQELIMYLRKYMNMNHCSFMPKVNNIESTAIKIHIHHSPITLYEIVIIIFEKRLYYKESLDPEMVAKEVAYVHYCFLVGLIPLCETIHELVHNEYIFIPNDTVLGYYNNFIEMYYMWIPQSIKDKLARLEDYTKSYNDAENRRIVEPNYIYIDFVGTYKLPKMEDLLIVLSNRMNNIQQNGYSVQKQPLVVFFDDKNNNIIK